LKGSGAIQNLGKRVTIFVFVAFIYLCVHQEFVVCFRVLSVFNSGADWDDPNVRQGCDVVQKLHVAIKPENIK
jgi:hypothetical protein